MSLPRQETLTSNRSVRPIRRRAMTLVEMLIVVTVLSIIAAIVVPAVDEAVAQSNESTVMGMVRELQQAIERYKIDHNGLPPSRTYQFIGTTTASGAASNATVGVYGPYVAIIPMNPLNGSDRVWIVQESPPADPTRFDGWIYNVTTGQIWAGTSKVPTGSGS